MRFEWDLEKATRNLLNHKVSFDEACESFFDSNAMDDFDEDHSDRETRYNLIGMSNRRLLFVVYCEPATDIVRIISARKADKKHKEIYGN